MRLTVTCLLCVLALPASAEIYKYTDANGNTVFTNQVPTGTPAETVNLPPVNTLQAPPPQAMPGNNNGNGEQRVYRVLAVAVPTEEALRANNGDVLIDVSIEPQLRPGDTLQLLLDGRPAGERSASRQLPLGNVDRGEHSLAVEAYSGDRLIQQSATVTFTVQRVNTSSPALRPTPPKPTPRSAN